MPPGDLGRCTCQTGFLWEDNVNGSISNSSGGGRCSFDCGGMQYSTGSLAVNHTDECQCLTFFEWNATSMKCVINCSSLSHASTASSSFNSCICDPKFVFSYTSVNVPECLLSCPLVNNTTPSSPNTTTSLTCPCRGGYNWNSTLLECEINCTAIGYTNGTVNTTYCLCSP